MSMTRHAKAMAFGFAFFFSLLLVGRVAGQDIPLDGYPVVHPYQRVQISNLDNISSTDTSSPAIAKAALAIVISASKLKCEHDSQLESIADANAGGVFADARREDCRRGVFSEWPQVSRNREFRSERCNSRECHHCFS